MKFLKPNKVKDGWLIKITDTRKVGCESDVYKTIRQEGLKTRHKQYRTEEERKPTSEVISIFAD